MRGMALNKRSHARCTTVLIFLVMTVLGLACSGADSSDEASPSNIPAPSGIGSDGEKLTLETVDGGSVTGLVITDHRGFAVYGTTGETADSLICVDDCTRVWIPLAPRDGAVADKLDESLYAVITRPDGIQQVTYAEVPLYLWTGDRRIGITGGAGVAGTWFALSEAAGFIG